MNKQFIEQPMDQFEARLAKVTRDFPYPPTPNIAGRVRQELVAKLAPPIQPSWRRLAWTMMALALALVLLLAVPPVRAAVFEAVRQGVVRVFLLEPLPTTTPLLLTITPVVSAEAPATASPSSFITPNPVATPISSVPRLTHEATPAVAQSPISPSARMFTRPTVDTTPQVKKSSPFY